MRTLEPYPVSHGTTTIAAAGDAARRTSARFKFGMLLPGVDVIALCLAAMLASGLTVLIEKMFFGVRPYTDFVAIVSAHRGVLIALGLVQMALFWSKGLYTTRMPWWSQVQYIGRVTILLFLLDGFLSFALRLPEPRILIGATWFFAFGCTVTLRWTACRFAARRGWTTIPTVLIGDNATVTDLVYAFNADPCVGYDVQTILLRDRDHTGFDVTDLPRAAKNVRVHDGLSEHEAFIRTNPNFFYVISLDSFRGETRDRLMRVLEERKIAYGVVPSISGVGLYEMEPRYFFGHDIMMLQPRTPRTLSLLIAKGFKRGLDIFVSGLALLLLLPLTVGVALMLKLEGQGGTIFYGGKRMGLGGESFSCWKFRSMEPNSDHLLYAYLESNPAAQADWDKYRKLPRDPRVTTRTARFIRKASIDELPQLWNVFVGDMSLVGPRPILHDEVSYFGDSMNEYTSVRPGLTGLWQVSGRNATSFHRRVYWDRWYVRNWTLWGDIVILIKTPIVLLTRQGAH